MHVQFYVSSQEDLKKKNFIQMAQAGKRKAKRKKKIFRQNVFLLDSTLTFSPFTKDIRKEKKKENFSAEKKLKNNS